MDASPGDIDAIGAAPGSPDLASYQSIIVAFSGGKDSLACLLHLLEAGVPRDKIELWHHDVDGQEGSSLMDWPCTRDYCRAVAAALGVAIYFSWKTGGFEREMLRDGSRTASTRFEIPGGEIREVGGERGKAGTRLRFPQVSADLTVRWCSAYPKIDVCAASIRNQERFRDKRTLVVTGERAEEDKSKNKTGRAGYARFEPDRSDGRGTKHGRHVDRWRPVHAWSEREVWSIIERWRINPHPAYRLGWGRVSCMSCIFGSPDQWASLARLAPASFERVVSYEDRFGVTIQRSNSVRKLAVVGQSYAWDEEDARAALRREFTDPVVLDAGAWRMPRGAFGESCGPT